MTTNEELAQKVKLAPSREWANSYFDLVKEILDVTKIDENNPRLLMSLLKKGPRYFPITINSRYVIVSEKLAISDNSNKQVVGLIFTPNYQEIPELRQNNDYVFRNRNPDIDPPYFLWFDSLDEVVSLLKSSKQVRDCWHDALIAEVGHAKLSRFRKYHQPKIYKFVTDKNFRTKILDMAFPKTDDEMPKDGSGGFGNPESNQKVEQAAISFVMDDYKKRGWSVKSVESEKHGFDLLCTKAKTQEHVEVKGVQGNSMSFIITNGEVRKSQSDKHFVLYVVKSALLNPKSQRFTAKEFNEKFTLETISYYASLKKK